MSIRERTYKDEENIKLYLRNILEGCLDYKEQKEREIHSRGYNPTSKEIIGIERDYMRYEEKVLAILPPQRIEIQSSKKIVVNIDKLSKKIELKEYLESKKILIENDNLENQREILERLENAHKIGEIKDGN